MTHACAFIPEDWLRHDRCRCGWNIPSSTDVISVIGFLEIHEAMHLAARSWHELYRAHGYVTSGYVAPGIIGIDDAIRCERAAEFDGQGE